VNLITRFRYFRAAILLPLILSGAVFAQGGSALPNPTAVVSAQGYVSLDGVPRGKEFQAAVVVHIANGFHMNSHKPSETYLIPTTLTPQLPAGVELVSLDYPDGRAEKFSFSPDKPLNVYTGSIVLRLRLKIQSTVRLGATTLPMTLRYQACNDTTCLPPVRVPVNVQLQVAAEDAPSHPVHPEIFFPKPASK